MKKHKPHAAPNAEERVRLDLLSRAGCVVCRLQHGAYVEGEIQHMTAGGRRLGHMFTIPLCAWHHRAVPSGSMPPDSMRQCYGPSFAESREAFEAAFGSEEELLKETNKWLGYRNNQDSRSATSTSPASSTTSGLDQLEL